MSRKTMDEYEDLYNIWPPPRTSHQQNDDTRAQILIDGMPEPQWARRLVVWDQGAHLDRAGEDFTDALWGINEGKRDVRRNRS